MKKIIIFLITIYGSLANSTSVNQNSTTYWDFDKTYAYWERERDLVDLIRSKNKINGISLKSNELSHNDFIALFQISVSGADVDKVKAIEMMTSACYKSKKNELISNIKDCLGGGYVNTIEVGSTFTRLQEYFTYRYNKGYHENNIKSYCMWNNLDNPSYSSETKSKYYKRPFYNNGKMNSKCDQYSVYNSGETGFPTFNNTKVLEHSSNLRGYKEKTVTINTNDFISIARTGRSRRNFDTGLYCTSAGTKQLTHASHAHTHNSSGGDRAYFSLVCISDPSARINTEINKACYYKNKILVNGAYTLEKNSWNKMCENWSTVGLLTGSGFIDVFMAGILASSQVTESGWAGADHQNHLNISRDYWGNPATLYGDLKDGYHEGASMSGYKSQYESCSYSLKGTPTCETIVTPLPWKPSSINLIKSTSTPTSLSITGRDLVPNTRWYNLPWGSAAQIKDYIAQNVNLTNIKIELPELQIEKVESFVALAYFKNGFVSLNNKVHNWLTLETDWSKATTYSCEDKVYSYYKHSDMVIGSNYMIKESYYSQKDVNFLKYGVTEQQESSIKAKIVQIPKNAYFLYGLKPEAVPITFDYKVCSGN
jgi:hypothetical protein